MPYVPRKYQTRGQREHSDETGNDNIPYKFLTRNQRLALGGSSGGPPRSRSSGGSPRGRSGTVRKNRPSRSNYSPSFTPVSTGHGSSIGDSIRAARGSIRDTRAGIGDSIRDIKKALRE